jgi:hypothetical protein
MPIYNHQPAKIACAGLSDEKGKDHLARIPFQGFTIPKQTLTAMMLESGFYQVLKSQLQQIR